MAETKPRGAPPRPGVPALAETETVCERTCRPPESPVENSAPSRGTFSTRPAIARAIVSDYGRAEVASTRAVQRPLGTQLTCGLFGVLREKLASGASIVSAAS